MSTNQKFGTAPVFFTAISTILGAVMFLRFGWAVGNVGFWGVIAIVLIGHMVTIPTAAALAEISTNQKVEGGGEYYIISRSFGLNIGAAIGFTLYLSQAISVAFYIVAFAEAFAVLKPWISSTFDISQEVINNRFFSIPALALLTLIILTKGASLGMKALYAVVAVLIASILMFFAGTTDYNAGFTMGNLTDVVENPVPFFTVFAICFPAFTGMTAGVGLSGDLKDPSKSIPLGTLSATLVGMVVYVALTYKLSSHASPQDLVDNTLIMQNIAVWGPIIPIGLAAATVSSALGSFLVAPRTLQALARDNVFGQTPITEFLSKGKGALGEPFNASILTGIIALVFVIIGDVNMVAEIISMFFMVTYGSLCLISFFQHFSGDPAYRPSFKSRWYVSLFGGLFSFYLMFQMNTVYAIAALGIMAAVYFVITSGERGKGGLAYMVQGVLSQFTRRMLVFLQKADKVQGQENWRPSVICISDQSFHSLDLFNLMKWISQKYGFGTYIHLIDGYFSSDTQRTATHDLERLVEMSNTANSNFYIDTLISPSYTSAIAQIVQLPGISGQDNNLILFEYPATNMGQLTKVVENYGMIKAAQFDVAILRTTDRGYGFNKEIHIWLSPHDLGNANLSILLGYIVMGHSEWKNGTIKVFAVFPEDELVGQRNMLEKLIHSGRLPVAKKNLTVFPQTAEFNRKSYINKYSSDADLTVVGLNEDYLKSAVLTPFEGYPDVGNMLFVASPQQEQALAASNS